MNRKSAVILIVTPKGIGGITTLVETIRNVWPLDSLGLRVLRVPRHSIKGWLTYPLAVAQFLVLLAFANVKVCHVNLSTGGSPIRKVPFVFLAGLFQIPIILQIHSGKFDTVYESESTSKFWKATVRFIIARATGILIINRKQKRFFENASLNKSSPTIFLPNAIQVSSQDNAKTLSEIKIYDFVFVGRVSEEKGVLDLLSALKMIRGYLVTVVLAGQYELSIEPSVLSSQALPHKLLFVGQLPSEEVDALLRKSKVLILPSHVENFPLVILEAFKSNVPVIATNVGEVPTLVIDGITGTVVPVSKPQQLASAMMGYLLDETKVKREGKNGFNLLREYYDAKDYPEKLLKAYKSFGVRI